MSRKHRRKPYMPDSDAGKQRWMERFLTQLEKDPKRYGFDDERMFEYIRRTIRTFISAAQAASNKGERSTYLVTEKNRARADAVALCREIAMRLKVDPTISDTEKVSLGLHIRDAAPEKAKLPEGALPGAAGHPTLDVRSSPNGGHVISFRNIVTGSTGKPKGVSHLLLFAAIGEQPRMRRTHARLLGAYTRRPFEIMYPTDCGIEGLYVTYYGRWLTARGRMSPWSPGVSKIIGDTQLSLGETDFAHLFGKEGFIDALPPGISQEVAEDPPLLEGDEFGQDGLTEVLDPEMLPMHAFAMLAADLQGQEADLGG